MIKPSRLLRHLLADERRVRRILPVAAMEAATRAIAEGERRHDGEVRLCVEASLPWSYLRRDAGARERALMMFSKLRIWDTERNTGVLVYVLLADRAIEIVADRGIALKVPQVVWDTICGELAQAFRADGAQAGVLTAIDRISDELAAHFPAQRINDNELPDALVVL